MAVGITVSTYFVVEVVFTCERKRPPHRVAKNMAMQYCCEYHEHDAALFMHFLPTHILRKHGMELKFNTKKEYSLFLVKFVPTYVQHHFETLNAKRNNTTDRVDEEFERLAIHGTKRDLNKNNIHLANGFANQDTDVDFDQDKPFSVVCQCPAMDTLWCLQQGEFAVFIPNLNKTPEELEASDLDEPDKRYEHLSEDDTDTTAFEGEGEYVYVCREHFVEEHRTRLRHVKRHADMYVMRRLLEQYERKQKEKKNKENKEKQSSLR